jgi:hypothetical protein
MKISREYDIGCDEYNTFNHDQKKILVVKMCS